MRDYQIGDRVIWTDPQPEYDGGVPETPGVIVSISGEVIGIDTDHGGYTEAYAHELTLEPGPARIEP